MYQIEMASGTFHAVSMCGAADGYLHIRLEDGESFAGIVAEFSDARNTETIIHHFGEMSARHDGYTTLISVQWEGSRRYRVALKNDRKEGSP